jgi:hypothetical protein
VDYGDALARAGFRHILISNGHGGPGHLVALEEAAARVSRRRGVTMASLTGRVSARGTPRRPASRGSRGRGIGRCPPAARLSGRPATPCPLPPGSFPTIRRRNAPPGVRHPALADPAFAKDAHRAHGRGDGSPTAVRPRRRFFAAHLRTNFGRRASGGGRRVRQTETPGGERKATLIELRPGAKQVIDVLV